MKILKLKSPGICPILFVSLMAIASGCSSFEGGTKKKDDAPAPQDDANNDDSDDSDNQDGGSDTVINEDLIDQYAKLATPEATLKYGIQKIRYSGSGCPKGKVGVALNNDKKLLTLLFEAFIAEAGGNNPASVEKDCRVEIDIVAPKNHAVGVYNQYLQGYSHLIDGQSTFSSHYIFNKQEDAALKTTYRVTGSNDAPFEFNLQTPLLWSPCTDKPVTIVASTKILAEAKKAGTFAYMAIDQSSKEFGLNINLDFIPCPSVPMPEPLPTPIPTPTPADDEIVCESINREYNSCRVNGIIDDVKLRQQYSQAACEFGKTFGFFDDRIWVNAGCRGLFKFHTVPNQPVPDFVIHEVKCESHAYAYTMCDFQDIAAAELLTKHSDTACERGVNWDVILDKGIWADKGCRATFRVVKEGFLVPKTFDQEITCESKENGFKTCQSTKPIKAIELIKQISNTTCVQNQNFGKFTDYTIWVDNGCHATFGITH